MATKNSFSLSRMAISEINIAVLHNKSPWLPMWWSAALPGLGHVCQGLYFRGTVLMSWEILVNFKSHLNLSIFYTFTGNFKRAADVLDTGWALFYGVIFCFAVFDSYRLSVEANMLARLERKKPRRKKNRYQFISFSTLGTNYLDKSNPWLALVWSALLMGFGHIYNKRALKAIILLGWGVAIIFAGNVDHAIVATFRGQFLQAKEIVDYQWLLFFPSIYVFSMWDAYNDCVEI